ncbi:MAG TPA: flagellar biosynthesis anti-sigma factor FlgM [Methylococcaceae bacterium]|jgi:negative regulator of flagellin synthesis FlgM|nr:flagellar biosynthesis anti-sigma factor FlgM [Methylococcaceae bacterium]HIN68988.1 flagellar biosynthesis anti-sigma factor FlgM [Methylococcales bacterium]HIA44661.1 flagellar biosynthesis anti-sigma factor FlgM [Methylococcaceae bacterium]HIB62119.1 flagellar biosynthesis anti-sigma factor FlgM [Methylococcaceae bacterium]HIO12935.1 flagellar biosynthesis anti-sigma factor FlgM [Methylococcales bacterium]
MDSINNGGIKTPLNRLLNPKVKEPSDTEANEGIASSEKNQGSTKATVEGTPLSDSIKDILSLHQTVKKMPEIDMDKVNHIKRALASGDYPLDTKKTVANMIRLESLLGS